MVRHVAFLRGINLGSRRDLARTLRDALGLEIAVVVRTRDDLADVIARDPFGEEAADPARSATSGARPKPRSQARLNRIAFITLTSPPSTRWRYSSDSIGHSATPPLSSKLSPQPNFLGSGEARRQA